MYHRSGDLEAEPGAPRCYAQLYIYDSDHLEEAVNAQVNNPINSNCDWGLMRQLTGVIHQNHRYAPLNHQIWEQMQENPVENISMLIRQNHTDDCQQYNRPSTNEIALVMPDGATELQRDIVVYKRGGGIQWINTWNPAYGPLHYVLLFPYGEHGFQRGIPHHGINQQNVANNEDEGIHFLMKMKRMKTTDRLQSQSCSSMHTCSLLKKNSSLMANFQPQMTNFPPCCECADFFINILLMPGPLLIRPASFGST